MKHQLLSVKIFFLNKVTELGLELDQLITEPTHNKGNILDLIFTSEPNLIQNININPPIPLCDHYLITCHWVVQKNSNRQDKTFLNKYAFSKADFESIAIELH